MKSNGTLMCHGKRELAGFSRHLQVRSLHRVYTKAGEAALVDPSLEFAASVFQYEGIMGDLKIMNLPVVITWVYRFSSQATPISGAMQGSLGGNVIGDNIPHMLMWRSPKLSA